MTRAYCPFLSKALGGRWKAWTFSLFLGLGLGGCSDDQSQEEPVKAEGDAGEAGEAAAPVDGEAGEVSDDAKAIEGDMAPPSDEAPATGDGENEAAPPPEEGEAASGDDQASTDGEAPALPAEQSDEGEADQTLTDAPVGDMTQVVAEDTTSVEPPQVTAIAPDATTTHSKKAGNANWANNTPMGATQKGTGGSYIVIAGDTLANIAQKIYGSSGFWNKVANLNNVQAPYVIYPGDELQFDALNDASKSFAANSVGAEQSVTVKHGDTLSGIAQQIYGNAGAWRAIYTRNKDKLTDPNRIEVGMVLSVLNPNAPKATAAVEAAPVEEAQVADDGEPAPAKKKKAPAFKGKKTSSKSKKAPVGAKKKTAH